MRKILLFSILFACSMATQAQFSGKGSGTEKDPYQITTADELFEVRNDLSAYYKVMDDIDLSEWIAENSPNYGWAPIGTESSPFTGNFDGNNKAIKGLFINRPNADAVGLFGAILKSTIKNVCLVGVNAKGKDYVGALIGRMYIITDIVEGVSIICDNVVVGGSVNGRNYIGGLLGGATFSHNHGISSYPFYYVCEVTGNYISLDVDGTTYCGGVIGGVEGGSYDRTYDWARKYIVYIYLSINDNVSSSRIAGRTAVGGILGHLTGNIKSDGSIYFIMDEHGNLFDFELSPYVEVKRNISNGVILGEDNVGGILGQAEGKLEQPDGKVINNVCVADTISSITTQPYRISSFTASGNYASISSIILFNHRQVYVEDNDNNGTGYSVKQLKKKTTYTGMEYDFLKEWAIVENETYPYHVTQSTPCTISSFICGSKATISGTASGTGRVYVFMGNGFTEGALVDGKWEVSLGNIKKGTIANVCVQNDGFAPSIFTTAVADDAIIVEKKLGDANGDGVVDTADVTAIINYILGKPSASFNKANADVTGDGDILIDDAVQTVQLIMNAQ